MTSEVDNISGLDLSSCPFSYCCVLEKKEFLCKLPECKNCVEYTELFKKMK